MNESELYQWEGEIAEPLPSLNSWQGAHEALMSDGVLKAEGCQQQKVARQMRGGGQVDSAARRIGRFLSNTRLDEAAFFVAGTTQWSCAGS